MHGQLKLSPQPKQKTNFPNVNWIENGKTAKKEWQKKKKCDLMDYIILSEHLFAPFCSNIEELTEELCEKRQKKRKLKMKMSTLKLNDVQTKMEWYQWRNILSAMYTYTLALHTCTGSKKLAVSYLTHTRRITITITSCILTP